MLQAFLISVGINLLLIAVIVILILIMLRKRARKIQEYNNDIINRDKILYKIEKMNPIQKRRTDEEVKKAHSIDDVINIFAKL
jgi:hypothetical protein